MAPMAAFLNVVSKASPLVHLENTEDEEPSPTDSDPRYLAKDERRKKKHRQLDSAPLSMRKPSSELGLRKRTIIEESTPNLVQATPCPSPRTHPSASLRPPRLKGHRSSSSSQVETGSYYGARASPGIIRHQAITNKLDSLSSMVFSGPSLNGRGSGTNNSANERESEDSGTNYAWSSSIRPNSDPDMRTTCGAVSKSDIDKPLKTCLKQKANSANTTPPNESMSGTTSSSKNRKLRRMKTVDFEDAVSKGMPSSTTMSNRVRGRQRSRPEKVLGKTLSCPGTVGLTRRSPASPAVTRTDVHVIAIAPTSSQNPSCPRDDIEADPATPTMQIVESSNGSYEVIWDDVPAEHSARVRRRSSSASQALEAIGSTATRGLERVNTKLTEWSGTWNTPSDSFKPTIIVFPDDDGRRPHFECAIVDDEDIEIFAPPNSESVSAPHSCHSSRPVSAPMSRIASQDALNDTAIPQDTLLDEPNLEQEQTLVSDQDAWSAHLVAARRKLGAPSPERKLSNADEADVKFRNHRDSVTIAHSRLIRSGGVRPELFAHSDSVSIAKKRLHAKNHTTSVSRHAHRPASRSEPDTLQDNVGNASGIPPLPVVKAHAVEALKKSTPASILRSRESSTAQHVRIEE